MYDLEKLAVLYQGRYVDIYQGLDGVLIKVFRAVPDSAEAALLFSMLLTLEQQQSQINLLQDNHTLPTRVVEARMGEIAVPAIARPWYSENVLEYLQRNPDTDKLSLVIDIAHGLAGLHSKGVAHGNLHPENIFVTDDGEARITDAAIYASIVRTVHADRVRIPLAWPYKAPEELGMVNYISTLQMDVYSFACVVFAMYTGRCPIECSPHSCARGIRQIIGRGHGGLLANSKPMELDGRLWAVLERCWAINTTNRPTMSTVEDELRELRRVLCVCKA